MSAAQTASDSFLPYKDAATDLGVPAAWLKVEAIAGRVPHLRAGRRILIDPAAAKAAILKRSEIESTLAIAESNGDRALIRISRKHLEALGVDDQTRATTAGGAA